MASFCAREASKEVDSVDVPPSYTVEQMDGE